MQQRSIYPSRKVSKERAERIAIVAFEARQAAKVA
jgi:hypothetical protein